MDLRTILKLKQNNKVLLIGPFPNPITGVSLANNTVKNVLDNSNIFTTTIINTSYPIFQDEVGKFSIKKLFFFIKINFKAYKVFKSDIIYITPGQTFFGVVKYAMYILLASVLKKELVIHLHGNYLGLQFQELKKIKKRIFYFLISKFNKGIVLSKSLINNLTPFIEKNNIYTLNNFAEDYLVDEKSPKEIKILKIVFLSNLMKEKGIIILLNALKELEKKNIPYEAKIAGNIDEKIKDEILKKIDSLNFTSYVGVVYNKDKKDLLDWSNIFVLPTFYKMEGQPISILEALATNNVVITTNHAGIPDVIKDKINGFIVKKKDSESIIDVLIFLNKNKSKILEICKTNKLYFANNFTIKRFSNQIVKILSI